MLGRSANASPREDLADRIRISTAERATHNASVMQRSRSWGRISRETEHSESGFSGITACSCPDGVGVFGDDGEAALTDVLPQFIEGYVEKHLPHDRESNSGEGGAGSSWALAPRHRAPALCTGTR